MSISLFFKIIIVSLHKNSSTPATHINNVLYILCILVSALSHPPVCALHNIRHYVCVCISCSKIQD